MVWAETRSSLLGPKSGNSFPQCITVDSICAYHRQGHVPSLEEKRISERAAIKKREQAEKKREAEAAQLAAELAATKKAEEAKKREAEKKRIADERAALLQLEQAEKIRKAEEELISKGKRTPKNKLMNKRKKPAPTNKKAGGKPSGGKIVKAKKNLSPRTPTRRSTRNKTTVFVRDVDSTRNSNSSGSSESNMSLDGSPSVYTMSNTTRKTSEVHDKVHQDYWVYLRLQDDATFM